MSERQYNDEEVSAIFERASATEHAALSVRAEGKGLTLAALQDIGREVGISPEAISLAARSLDQAGRPASRRFMGLPIGVGRTVELDGPLTDSDWERLVADLRETFEARGTVRYDGPFRQWTNGNLQALVEPTPNGHRLRLQTLKGNSRSLMTGGIALLGAAAATLLAVAIAGSVGHAGSLAGPGFMALMGLGMFATGALSIPGWARRRRTQIEEVTARLALATKTRPKDDANAGGDSTKLNDFATRYTAAWCSQNAASVASFFAKDGSLTINQGRPSVGRAAISAAAQEFMTAFPDMVVKMDRLGVDPGRITYHWTLIGTNTGPGGTGKAVRISGYEEWRIGDDGLIAESKGHFDEAEDHS